MRTGRKKLPRPPSECHPNLPAFRSTGGLCVTCYKREWARAKRKANPPPPKEIKIIKAKCHPDRKHWGKGLCLICYAKSYRKRNPQSNKTATAKWRAANKDKQLNKYLRYRYGITLDDYTRLLKEQQNSCKLCGLTPPKSPVVDHNHLTEKVRGIVCQRCNIAIGAFENYIELQPAIKEYLEYNGN